MTDLTIGDYLTGIQETREAIKRADNLLARASELAIAKPSTASVALADSASKMKALLESELEELEWRLTEAEKK